MMAIQMFESAAKHPLGALPMPSRGSRAQRQLTLWELGAGGGDSECHSPFCLKVHRALCLLGLAYTRRRASSPEVLRRMNPTGQAPVLVIDGVVVVDSTSIVVLDALEARAPYEGFWLGTGRPTIADIALYAQLHALRSPLTPLQAREVLVRPRLSDWLDRVGDATSAV